MRPFSGNSVPIRTWGRPGCSREPARHVHKFVNGKESDEAGIVGRGNVRPEARRSHFRPTDNRAGFMDAWRPTSSCRSRGGLIASVAVLPILELTDDLDHDVGRLGPDV